MSDQQPGEEKAAENLGPHLLGRFPSEPDRRNFDAGEVMRRLESGPVPDDSLLDKTIREARDEGYFASWRQVLVFWRWLKHLVNPPPPSPPTPPGPPSPPTPPTGMVWVPAQVLDQGQSSRCIGFGGEGWLGCTPIVDPVSQNDAIALYCECTVLDGNPETPQTPLNEQHGSTVHTLAKAMKNRGRISLYAWAATVDDMVKWLESYGPVIMGTTWYDAMFQPDASGLAHATGGVAGGHCYFAYKADPDAQQVWFRNSWGKGWAVDGNFALGYADITKLLRDEGEALTCLELPLPTS